MKKIIALLTALCLVLCCVSALGEALRAGGDPVEFDGFTLNLEEGVIYQQAQKLPSQVYVTVYPYYTSGDQATNINCTWIATSEKLLPETVKADLEASRSSIEKGFADAGYSLDSYEFTDPAEKEIGGVSCVVNDNKMLISAGGMSVNIYQRVFYFGEKGFIFTVSAAGSEDLENACAWLESVLLWP
ncbi:MAG: hypothetical protein K6F61_04350 [Clostridiales bacterium]|nr:hypothetical protein [Clostridiales bacterium]